MAIAYLDAMAKGARQESVKKTLNVRKNAFLEVRSIEKAREGFTNNRGRLPESIDELVSSGFLDRPPKDPYGGKFTIGSDGRISSTSGFSFAGSAR